MRIATIERLGRESGAYVAILRTDTELVTKGEVWGSGEYAAGRSTRRAHAQPRLLRRRAVLHQRRDAHDGAQKRDLLDFIGKDGKGFIGVHTAAITAASWPDYAEMLGGFFDNHPGTCERPDRRRAADSPIMRGFSTGMELVDEHYQLLPHPYDRSKRRRAGETGPDERRSSERRRASLRRGLPSGVDEAVRQRPRVLFVSRSPDAAWDDPRVQTMYLEAIKWVLGVTQAPVRPHPITEPAR